MGKDFGKGREIKSRNGDWGKNLILFLINWEKWRNRVGQKRNL
jgi:hypothetical protein